MPRGRPRKDASLTRIQDGVKKIIPRPYRNADELKKKMQEYFNVCDEDEVFPDEAGMRIFLDLGHESYRSYLEDTAYEKVFDWAQDMRESWAARRLAAEPRNAQAFLNILKQTANGGWVDRKTDNGDKTLSIKIAGVGGEEAFK